MELLESWVTSANSSTTNFPLNNLPYGVFSTDDLEKRCGVAIGDMILDCQAVEAAGLINFTNAPLLQSSSWNGLMELGPLEWARFRMDITSLLCKKSEIQGDLKTMLVRQTAAELHMPFQISEFTDFWSSKNHAINAGIILRGAENALPENWRHIPIGYNGRASSVNVSGTNFRRPWGQIKRSNVSQPEFSPSERFDFELEMGAIVGVPSNGPVTVQEADDMIFGYVVLNDWSARDIQAWEGQPLGPFQAKATATTISPWIVTKAALEPFRCSSPARDYQLLSYLEERGSMFYDIDLTAILTPKDGPPCIITQTNFRKIYYTSAQQLAHHTTSGCPMNSGDLLGSGTISGSRKLERGSMLELSWGGREPLTLENGEVRSFLEDFDTLTLCARARSEHITIGFGNCTGTLLPALVDPYNR
jgi:fumarylacetoacetase